MAAPTAVATAVEEEGRKHERLRTDGQRKDRPGARVAHVVHGGLDCSRLSLGTVAPILAELAQAFELMLDAGKFGCKARHPLACCQTQLLLARRSRDQQAVDVADLGGGQMRF